MNRSVCSSIPPLNSSLANSSASVSCEVNPQHISIPVFLSLVFLVGFFLNSFSLWVFCCRLPKWTSGTVLQFHLALSDAISILVTPFMAAYFSKGGHWPFGNVLCKLKTALLFIHLNGSIVFLTLISVHRYVTVVLYKRSSLMKQNKFVHILCAGVWLFLLAEGIACFNIFHTSQVGNSIQCLSIHQGRYINLYFIVNFILLISGFLLPFSVSLACYIQLARSVFRIQMNTLKNCNIKSRSVKMVVLFLVMIGMCFAPMNVIRTVAVVVKRYYPGHCGLLLQVETAYYVSCILAGLNCCLNPLLYCFASQTFVKSIHRSLRRPEVRVADCATTD